MKSIKNLFIEMTVKSMLNPENKDFYIKHLSLDKVEQMLSGEDNDLVACFWSAYCIAQAKYLEQVKVFERHLKAILCLGDIED